MLALTRRIGEEIVIGDPRKPLGVIRVIDIQGDKVRLSFDFPREMSINRRELAEQKAKQGDQSSLPPKTIRIKRPSFHQHLIALFLPLHFLPLIEIFFFCIPSLALCVDTIRFTPGNVCPTARLAVRSGRGRSSSCQTKSPISMHHEQGWVPVATDFTSANAALINAMLHCVAVLRLPIISASNSCWGVSGSCSRQQS